MSVKTASSHQFLSASPGFGGGSSVGTNNFPSTEIPSEAVPSTVQLPESSTDPNPLTTDNDPDLRAANYTPATDGTWPITRPDLAMFCGDCGIFVDLRDLNTHRSYHKHLQIMRYKGSSRPETVEGLMKRRRAILRKMRSYTDSENPLDPQDLQKVNDAFEFLKADVENTYESYRQIRGNPNTQVEGLALNCSADCVSAVGICADGNQRYKSFMEDTRVFQDCFGNDPHKCFFAVFDGHHGRFAAEVAATELHHAMLLEMEKFDPRTKCTCAHNLVDEYDLGDYELHSRASTRLSERGAIHEESQNIIDAILQCSEERLAKLMADDSSTSSSPTPKKEKPKKKSRDPFAEKMSNVFMKAHKCVDVLLSYGKDESSRVRWSGCSTLACVLRDVKFPEEEVEGNDHDVNKEDKTTDQTDNKSTTSQYDPPTKLGVIHLANAGNVRALLIRGNKHYNLSKDHSPYNKKENTRVLKAGGTISESDRELRVNGVLTTTRGLGNHGDPDLRRCVVTEPYTTHISIDQYAQFLVLASKGLWEVFSDEEVTSLLLQMVPSNFLPPPSNLSSAVQQLIMDDQSSYVSGDGESRVTTGQFGLRDRAATGSSSIRSVRINLPDDEEPTAENGHHRKHTAESIVRQAGTKTESLSSAMGDGGEQGAGDHKPEADKIPTTMPKVFGLEPGTDSRRKSERSREVVQEWASTHDMVTEVGSRLGDFDNDDSGNEADVETCTDGYTLPSPSRMSVHVPSREELQREHAKKMAERMVQAALLAGARDNITVMVLLLPGCGL